MQVSKQESDLLYTIFKNNIPLDTSETEHFLSKVCLDLKNEKNCDISFDAAKPKLDNIIREYEEQAKKHEEQLGMKTKPFSA